MATMHTKPHNTDTSGSISTGNTLVGGILGLAGAPTFQEGENVIDIIKRDHRECENLYEKYTTAADIKQRQEFAWKFMKSIVQHSEVEQLLVYPLLKLRHEGQPANQNLHDRSLNEHQELRELLYQLDQTPVEDPSHAAKFSHVMKKIKEHVAEEESEVLPTIQRNYKEDELRRMGNAFEVHKYTAVTRPHPHAPLQGPLAAAVNMATKPIDLARDAVRQATEKHS